VVARQFNKPTVCSRRRSLNSTTGRRPVRDTYRMVVVRKNLSVEKGEQVLFADIRYFFYLTNDWGPEAYEIVFAANDRL